MLSIEIIMDDAIERGMRDAPGIMMRHLRAGLRNAADKTAREAELVAPKAFSTLTDSIHAERSGAEGYKVSPDVAYADDVEYGREPGTFPSVQHILDWVRIKHIIPHKPDMSERDLAYQIAHGIFLHGTKPHPFAQPTHERMQPRIHDILRQSALDGLREAGLA